MIYRIAAFAIAAVGLLANMEVFTGKPNYYALFAYTTQSNILVCLFFLILIVKTAAKIIRKEEAADKNYGFYPLASFAISFAILITMLIFWLVLAPANWADVNLLTFFNLGVHFINPLLMIADRLLFYKKGAMRKYQPLVILFFPYVYILQSFALGLNHAVYFEPIGIESYYIYPFLDFDQYGALVFAFIAGLTVLFLLLAYGIYFGEKKFSKKNS